MSNLFSDKSAAIQKGEPINHNGLWFYPIRMAHYEEYLASKPALLLRQSTLPAAYASKIFLEAVYDLEMASIKSTGVGVGLLRRLLDILCLSLKIPSIGDKTQPPRIDIVCAANAPETLIAIRVRQNGVEADITPKGFNLIRQLLAKQNGDTLPDEADNPELVQAEIDFANIQTPALESDAESLIDTVAYNSHIRATEILDWTIREFENRRKTIRRDKLFTLYAAAELSGMTKFPKGNPYPSHEFDRIFSGSAVLKPEGEVLRKYGQTAATN